MVTQVSPIHCGRGIHKDVTQEVGIIGNILESGPSGENQDLGEISGLRHVKFGMPILYLSDIKGAIKCTGLDFRGGQEINVAVISMYLWMVFKAIRLNDKT